MLQGIQGRGSGKGEGEVLQVLTYLGRLTAELGKEKYFCRIYIL